MEKNKQSRRGFLISSALGIGAISTLGWSKSKYWTGQRGGDLKRIAEYLRSKKAKVWLFTGDSITQGAKHTHGLRSYPEVFTERVRWELGRARDIIINTAISGSTTADLVNDFNWRVSGLNPNVVSIMLGTNDCADAKKLSLTDFEHNLESLIDQVRGSGAIPLLQVPTPIVLEKAQERQRIEEYVQTVRRVANSKEVIIIDHWDYWQDTMRKQGKEQVLMKWLNDPLHPNGIGHLEMAKLLFRCLDIFDAESSTCGAPYYIGEL